ncbi:MlaD family protein [Pseudonocardia acaciae]|uniref:MlaD family protein n=1 Tax=Pseudonocardia acaciae TaxID=551276 RepID=UPI0004910B0F|nr:MlaD family protein [Pseudonocardia acaciae]
MRLSAAGFRTLTLVAFVLAIATLTGYLYAQAGGYIPGFTKTRDYRVSMDTDTAANIVPFSDVQVAGVPVGKVAAVTRVGQDIRLELALDEVATPVHQGATVQISEKALTGQPMVRLVDGTGPALPSGTVLPRTAVKPVVQLRDVLAGLDKPTRDSLGGVVRSLSQSTDGRSKDLSGVMAGLSDIGRNGDTALDALARQSADLEQVSRQMEQIFDALDTGQGQISQLVSSANRLTAATAGQRPALEETMRKLPPVLDSAHQASGDIEDLSGALAPIAADLRDAAPDLNSALDQLPEATRDLRCLLPPLREVLDAAPPTLHRIPHFGKEARETFPPAIDILRDLNPALRYLKPYGREIATTFVNFGGGMHHYGDDGASFAYLKPNFGGNTPLRPGPLKLPGSIYPTNPYPVAGTMGNHQPFTGAYPHVERDGG